jgi:hypothetical protein
MNKVRLLFVLKIKGIEEIIPESQYKVVAVSLMMNQDYWKLQVTSGVNPKEGMKLFRVL